MANYYVWSGAAGSGTGASWANAFTTLPTAFSGRAAGDVFWVAHDHAETSASSVQYNAPGSIANPCKIICVNRSGSVPPVVADRLATAQCTTTTTGAITINGFGHYDGIIFTSMSGASAGTLQVVSNAGQWLRLDNCSLRLGTTATTSTIAFGTTAAQNLIELNNTTVSFGAATQTINVISIVKWRNTASAVIGTVPTNLFTTNTNRGAMLECHGVDLSALGSGKTLLNLSASSCAHIFRFVDCKLDAAVTKSTLAQPYPGLAEVDFSRSGATGNYAVYRHRVPGTLVEETTIVRTGGASDGTTPLAWKVVTTANCNISMPFETPPIAIWVDTTGSPVTATVEGVWGGGAVPNDDECFLQAQYLSDASSPLAMQVNDGRDLLTAAAAQASSSETWGGSTTKFKLAVTFTPQMKGWIYARAMCAKASSTFYLDPLITLS